jgi:hypothetical protein
MTDTIFSVQDDSGTVAQITLAPSPSPALPFAIEVGDTGRYEGIPDNGVSTETFQSVEFAVVQTLDDSPNQFSVTAANANMSDWPANGQITWLTGANAAEVSQVTRIDGANSYSSVEEFLRYLAARGLAVPQTATTAQMRAALVQATDYLDQRYRYAGIKLLQTMGNNASVLNNSMIYSTWLYPYNLSSALYLTPSTSKQSTMWPRQGVIDNSGNTVNGIPAAIQGACSLLALRVLAGTALQPDFDPTLGGQGGLVRGITKKIGPLETSIQYDTQQGVNFFASFPQIDRMLKQAGLLFAGGGRVVVR